MEHKRGKILHSDARKIVYNVIKYFEEEKNTGRYHPLEYSNARSCMATGLSKNTISRIKKEGDQAVQQGKQLSTPTKGQKGKKNTRVPVDNFMLTGIRGIVSSIYDVRKEVPTLNKILASAKKDLDFVGSNTTLRKILINKLGFRFKKCNKNRSLLLERNNIKAWRAKYLRRIRRNDALGSDKKPVIYLDETWIHAHYTVSKCWQSTTDKGVRKNDSPGQRWIIVHAGSENGFVEGADLIFKAKSKKGDYHDEMNGENFTKYIKEKLIPNIPSNSIVVMDNAPYHSMQQNKPPTIANRKADIQKWLTEKDISFDQSYTKAELLEIVKRYKPDKDYAIDKILADHGHETLRLPPYNCDLNPIEYVWNLIKQRVAEKNVDQLEKKIEGLTREAIASITAEDWQKEVNHVKRLEKDYWTREVSNEDEIEDFIISVGLNSDSESDDGWLESMDEDEEAMSGVEFLEDPGEGTSNRT